jgi:indole-3-glycerol phosphate synthase
VATRGTRRFSEAIAEGDGISVVADVRDADAARAAESDGADAIVIRSAVAGVREATELPILWCAGEDPQEASDAGADAWLLAVGGRDDDDDGRLARLQARAVELGLDCVLEVRTEEELELALEALDPEIFLLAAGDERETLDHALDLLPDIPAGKLAIASIRSASLEHVIELERAGVDGVLVSDISRIAELAGTTRSEF